MPGIRFSRATALALFLSIGLLPSSQAGEQSRIIAQHLRARAIVRESGNHPDKRAQAMRYTRMAVLRAKCELHSKDKRRCARYTAGSNAKAPNHAAPTSLTPPAAPLAATTPNGTPAANRQ